MIFLALFLALSTASAMTLGTASQKVSVSDLVPGAEKYGPLEKNKPYRTALKGEDIIGYVFLNTDFDRAIGYSGKPIFILIGIDPKGKITGSKMVGHSEPIVLAGIPDSKIVDFIDAYKGIDIIETADLTSKSEPPVDIVSGATVTVLVIDDSIRNSALLAARKIGIGGLSAEVAKVKETRSLIKKPAEQRDWLDLLGDGSVRRLNLTVGEINENFIKTGDERAIARPLTEPKETKFIELYAASLAIPTIAKSLLGEAEYAHLQKKLKPGHEAFLFMANGLYSFKGSGYVRGGIFDRFMVVQDRQSIRFRDRGHKRLSRVKAEGAPRFREMGVFITPKEADFNAAWPWRLQLLVAREVGAIDKVFTHYELSYNLPRPYVKIEREAPKTIAASPDTSQASGSPVNAKKLELWQRIWQQKMGQVIVLSISIVFLTLIFFFQNYLVEYPRLTRYVRDGFLLFTLIWIGWYAQAQLSVVNVLVFANALITEFRWEFFLLEPLIFILWCSVAASLLFWGRGAFCGWLCPFGALQELLNRIAKAVKIPQYQLPWGLHERLWPIKYLLFLGLLGFSFYSLTGAEKLAEVEPFKTSIVLRFMREWPFLMFALVVLGIGLFIERFYCRYICPLGAALAIPGRIAMFDWLKRYRNCGDPCHLCAQDCMVQAITPMGDINPNECLHCLNCQVKYFDDQVCPVMILKKSKAGNKSPDGQTAEELEGAKALYRKPRRLGKSRTIEPESSVDA